MLPADKLLPDILGELNSLYCNMLILKVVI